MTYALIKRISGWLSLTSSAAFIGNMLIGKFRVVSGTGIAAPLDGVPEFVLLALSVAFFAVYMLHADRPDSQEDNKNSTTPQNP